MIKNNYVRPNSVLKEE